MCQYSLTLIIVEYHNGANLFEYEPICHKNNVSKTANQIENTSYPTYYYFYSYLYCCYTLLLLLLLYCFFATITVRLQWLSLQCFLQCKGINCLFIGIFVRENTYSQFSELLTRNSFTPNRRQCISFL